MKNVVIVSALVFLARVRSCSSVTTGFFMVAAFGGSIGPGRQLG
jgi:hypothetical protein